MSTRFVDTLYRFFKNDADPTSGIQWNVSGGQLDKRIRYYRIYYESNESWEANCSLLIDTFQPTDLQPFVDELSSSLLNNTCVPFLKAIQTMFKEDPWLQKAPCKFED